MGKFFLTVAAMIAGALFISGCAAAGSKFAPARIVSLENTVCGERPEGNTIYIEVKSPENADEAKIIEAFKIFFANHNYKIVSDPVQSVFKMVCEIKKSESGRRTVVSRITVSAKGKQIFVSTATVRANVKYNYHGFLPGMLGVQMATFGKQTRGRYYPENFHEYVNICSVF